MELFSLNDKKVMKLFYDNTSLYDYEYALLGKREIARKANISIQAVIKSIKRLKEKNIILLIEYNIDNKYNKYIIDLAKISKVLQLRIPQRPIKGQITTRTLGILNFTIKESMYNPLYREMCLNYILPEPEILEEENYYDCEYGTESYIPVYADREQLSDENISELASIFNWYGFKVTEDAIRYNYENWSEDYKSEFVDEENKVSTFSPCGCNPFRIYVNELAPDHNRRTYYA